MKSAPDYDATWEMTREGALRELFDATGPEDLMRLTVPAAVIPVTQEEIWRCIQAHENERGDAWLFTRLFRDRRCYDNSLTSWFIFDGHYWRPDKVSRLLNDISELVMLYKKEIERVAGDKNDAIEKGDHEREKVCDAYIKKVLSRIKLLNTSSRSENIIKLSRSGEHYLTTSGEEWDRNTWLLACANGVIDLKTGTLRKGRPQDFIKTAVPTRWEGPDAACPQWEKFLHEIFEENEELIDFVQKLFGYAVSGQCSHDIYTIMYGRGRSGKTTMLKTIKAVLGPMASSLPAETLMDQGKTQSGGAPNPEMLKLRGQRIVWASESGEGRKLNIERIKYITGGDIISARGVHGKEYIDFEPTHTLLLLTNHKPRVGGEDYAFWQRVRLIPFNLSFIDNPVQEFERKEDHHLEDRLKTEASGILAWLVRGCLKWQQEGLPVPRVVMSAIDDYKSEEDILGAFLDECTEGSKGSGVTATALYKAYRQWAGDNNHHMYSSHRFGKLIKTRLSWEKIGVIYYTDITLAEAYR